MPMITVRFVTPTNGDDLRPRVAELARSLAHEKLGKDQGVTAVLVEKADPAGWWIAGKHPTDAELAAFWLDIKVTAGTIIKAETTAFVKAVHEGMRGLLGPTHDGSYVLIYAVDGDAYGYGGRTQNGRWSAASPA